MPATCASRRRIGGSARITRGNILRYGGSYLSVKAPGVFEPFIDSTDKTPVKVEFDAVATGTCESSEVMYQIALTS